MTIIKTKGPSAGYSIEIEEPTKGKVYAMKFLGNESVYYIAEPEKDSTVVLVIGEMIMRLKKI